ncbi:hypothetical protein ACWDMY_35755, partial [Streptomyces globisporus]
RGNKKTEKATFSRTGGMCPRCEGRGSVSDIDLESGGTRPRSSHRLHRHRTVREPTRQHRPRPRRTTA